MFVLETTLSVWDLLLWCIYRFNSATFSLFLSCRPPLSLCGYLQGSCDHTSDESKQNFKKYSNRLWPLTCDPDFFALLKKNRFLSQSVIISSYTIHIFSTFSGSFAIQIEWRNESVKRHSQEVKADATSCYAYLFHNAKPFWRQNHSNPKLRHSVIYVVPLFSPLHQIFTTVNLFYNGACSVGDRSQWENSWLWRGHECTDEDATRRGSVRIHLCLSTDDELPFVTYMVFNSLWTQHQYNTIHQTCLCM